MFVPALTGNVARGGGSFKRSPAGGCGDVGKNCNYMTI